jgi:hypothetical protein
LHMFHEVLGKYSVFSGVRAPCLQQHHGAVMPPALGPDEGRVVETALT